MELAKVFFFKIIAPMIWLSGYAYLFTLSAFGLTKAWKAQSFKDLWLNIWLALFALYFLIYGGK